MARSASQGKYVCHESRRISDLRQDLAPNLNDVNLLARFVRWCEDPARTSVAPCLCLFLMVPIEDDCDPVTGTSAYFSLFLRIIVQDRDCSLRRAVGDFIRKLTLGLRAQCHLLVGMDDQRLVWDVEQFTQALCLVVLTSSQARWAAGNLAAESRSLCVSARQAHEPLPLEEASR